MKTLIFSMTFLVFSIVSTLGVGVLGADHNWTIRVGDHYYGVSGYKPVAIPGLRVPAETRLHFGEHAISLLIPFHSVVIYAAVGLLGVVPLTGTIVWRQRK